MKRQLQLLIISFILTGFFVGLFMKFFEKFKKLIRWVEIFAGAFLVFIGILIFTNKLQILMNIVPPIFYEFSK